MNKFSTISMGVIIAFGTATFGSQAEAAILYGHGHFDHTLYQIDTSSQSVTSIGTGVNRQGPEIEFTPDGSSILFSDRFGPDKLSSINPANGQTASSVIFSGFPLDQNGTQTNAITGLEYVGSTLYGSAHQAGPESTPGELVTVNTSTGALTTIGTMTNMDRPTGGMDFFNGIMYAVTSTNNNDSALFTINLGTGAASLVASLTIGGVQTETVSGLASAGGSMYALHSRFPGDTNLYSVNLTTGAMTVAFDMGKPMNALTAHSGQVPEPTTIAIFSLGLFGFGVARRRLSQKKMVRALHDQLARFHGSP